MYYLVSRCLMMIHLMRYIYFDHLMWFCIYYHPMDLSGTCFRIFSLVTICDHLTSYASYLLVLFSYLFSNVFIWCCCCFTCLKFWKKWVFLYFFEVLRHFPTYSDIFRQYHQEVTFRTLADTFPDTKYTALIESAPANCCKNFNSVLQILHAY